MKKTAIKRLLCSFLLTTGFACIAEAQPKFVQIGMQAGLNITGMYGDPYIETFMENSSGIALGPSVYYPFRKKWAVKSNIFFEKKGAKGSVPLFDDEGKLIDFYDTEVKYNYLTLPLLFDFYFGNRLKGNLTAGPYIGLMLGQATAYTSQTNGESFTDKSTAYYVPWDGGFVLGAGGRYTLTKRLSISLESRFNIGLANIVSRPVLNSLTIYNNCTQVLLGIWYTPGYVAGKLRGTN